MSKQSEAKKAQHYTAKAHNCGDCKYITSDFSLPAWMAEQNAKTPGRWGDNHQQEKNIRCAIGEFTVKKQGICSLHEVKP